MFLHACRDATPCHPVLEDAGQLPMWSARNQVTGARPQRGFLPLQWEGASGSDGVQPSGLQGDTIRQAGTCPIGCPAGDLLWEHPLHVPCMGWPAHNCPFGAAAGARLHNSAACRPEFHQLQVRRSLSYCWQPAPPYSSCNELAAVGRWRFLHVCGCIAAYGKGLV